MKKKMKQIPERRRCRGNREAFGRLRLKIGGGKLEIGRRRVEGEAEGYESREGFGGE